jgi:hypothetical protein
MAKKSLKNIGQRIRDVDDEIWKLNEIKVLKDLDIVTIKEE